MHPTAPEAAPPGDRRARRGPRGYLPWAALLLARATFGLTPSDPTVLCGQAEADAPVACRAYLNAFRSVGYQVRLMTPESWSGGPGDVVVVPGAEAARLPATLRGRLVAFVEGGGRLLTALDTPLARALGVSFADVSAEAGGVRDVAAPEVAVRWRTPVAMRPFTAPEGAKVFCWTESREHTLAAAFPRGHGAVLFLGVELDEQNPLGTSRFPYLLQAVGAAFDIAPPLASSRLAVYADLGDHKGQDPEAIAARWWDRGISEVHLGTWDAWGAKLGLYERLIAACHRRGILVYAWFELPEVTRHFWDAHPEWREKTATGADAHVDWRRLMALSIPGCFEAVTRWVVDLLERFDWDGADLAEVYFESPLGLDRPELLTPFNQADREESRARTGFDPKELFDRTSSRYFRNDGTSLAAFLAYRRERVLELHTRLLEVLAGARERKPHLDLVLTLVDALYDPNMRDRLGIDTRRIVGLGTRFPFELQVEDPFTLWALGPERYARMASDYAGLVAPGQRLAVDINIVPRGGDVRPTVQQTGLELYRLVAEARRGFPKVCLYSEASVYPQDGALLRSALAATAQVERAGARGAEVESDGTVELSTGSGAVAVRLDRRPWPAARGGTVLIPQGRHVVEWGEDGGPTSRLRLLGITGVLLDAAIQGESVVVRYVSPARAYVRLGFAPGRAFIDGVAAKSASLVSEDGFVLSAPPGEHTLRLFP